MDELGLSPLFDLLEELTLPPIPAAFTKKTSNYIEQMARVKRVLGKDVFFGLDVVPDPRNKSNNIMLLDVPTTSSPLPTDRELEKRLKSIKSRIRKLDDDVEGEEDADDLNDAEVTYMIEVIKQIIGNGTIDICASNDESTSSDEKEIVEVVDTLYELSNTLFFLSHNENNQTVSEDDLTDGDYILVDELQKLTDEYVTEVNSTLTPKQFWRPFIESLFKDIVTLDLEGKDKVLVANLAYMKDVALVLSLAEEEEIETYIWWVVVDIVAPHSSEGLRKAWSKYIDLLVNVEFSESKSLHCASAVNSLMGMAVSWLFVDPSFHEEKGSRVLEMLEDIRQAFATLVLNTDWMDAKTKVATLEKNRKMASEIGFPKWLFEEGALDEYYEGISPRHNI